MMKSNLYWFICLVSLINRCPACRIEPVAMARGYVYIYWRDCAIPEQRLGSCPAVYFGAGLMFAQLLWIFARRYGAREQRKQFCVLDGTCIPMSNSGIVVWLLDAAEGSSGSLLNVFLRSPGLAE